MEEKKSKPATAFTIKSLGLVIGKLVDKKMITREEMREMRRIQGLIVKRFVGMDTDGDELA